METYCLECWLLETESELIIFCVAYIPNVVVHVLSNVTCSQFNFGKYHY